MTAESFLGIIVAEIYQYLKSFLPLLLLSRSYDRVTRYSLELKFKLTNKTNTNVGSIYLGSSALSLFSYNELVVAYFRYFST